MKYIITVFAMCMVSLLISQEHITYNFRVEGMCGMCKERIEKIAIDLGKAESASWDVDTKMLTVVMDEPQNEVSAVKWYLSQNGHDNGDFLAPDEIYADLHSCCKYRGSDAEEQQHEEVEPETGTSEHGDGQRGNQDHGHVHEATGYIFAMDGNKKITLIGANITFEGAAAGTVTDENGYFELDNEGHHEEIRISYIGYEDQVIKLEDAYLEVTLADGHTLETVEIVYRRKTTEISFINTVASETITREELCKAACCNLSESFETNPSVDVSFNDAVTGTKQIQMLGLAGANVQITRELIPDVRTLNTVYGLNITPGPWIESIQLIKGTGSVVNGYESIAGQINVEIKKPTRAEKLHLNAFVNNGQRIEFNANARTDLGKKISTGVLVHGKRRQAHHDNNNDGFTDMPQEQDYVLMNRWKFKRTKNFEGQLGIKHSGLSHSGGSVEHFDGSSSEHDKHWRMNSDTKRNEVWGKLGYIFPTRPHMSIGLQMSAVNHDQDAYYGATNLEYLSEQTSFYTNLIYQNIFKNGHTLRTGITFHQDEITERVSRANIFKRAEKVPGAYVEYAIVKDKKWSIIPGLRIDNHNNYGTFITPRIHAKYNFADRSVIRATAGRGLRTANIFAENMGLFAGNRIISIKSQTDSENPYGLDAEVAWNYGVSFNQGILIGERDLILSLDFFRTEFENQIVVNWEDPRRVTFDNLKGQSYSNSFQIKLDYEVFKNFDVRVAYRLFDVHTTYEENLLEKPFVSKHRSFANFAYKTESDWHFDFTLNWRGSMRLPDTSANPAEHQRRDRSPSYFIGNGQIMKRWGKKWDVYLGGENLFNYKQTDAIIAGDDPFGEYFDASIVWAPLFGANVYMGFRYNLE